MRINENTDVNAFYLFPTRYGLKLASNVEPPPGPGKPLTNGIFYNH